MERRGISIIFPFVVADVRLEDSSVRRLFIETHFSSIYSGKPEFFAFVLSKNPGIRDNPGVGVIAKQILDRDQIFESLVKAYDVIPKATELAVRFSFRDAIRETFRSLFFGRRRDDGKISRQGVLVGTMIFLVKDVLKITSRPVRLDIAGQGWLELLYLPGTGFMEPGGTVSGFSRVLNWLYKRDDSFRDGLKRLVGSV